MPTADVAVIGAGLAGLTAAHALARNGARVIVLAKGFAATHWTAGTLDVAAPRGVSTPRAGVAALARVPGHPYQNLAVDVEQAVGNLLRILEPGGLPYVGDVDSPIRAAPTGIGGTRPVAIVPRGQAAAVTPWMPGETLLVCGISGFKDLWATAAAASLRRADVWSVHARAHSAGSNGVAPERVIAANADLPGAEGRRNLTALHLARAFDDRSWRAAATEAIARAVETSGLRGPGRVALPAVLGLREHAAVFDALQRLIGLPLFELPIVPPSIPGMRLYDALRGALGKLGVQVQLGESISRFEARSHRVELVAMPTAAREYVVRATDFVLATGGVAGGGIVAQSNGTIEETVLRLPVESVPRGDWFSADPFAPAGHAIEAAGLRTDNELRPIDATGAIVYDNVRICGSLLAGQRWLRERCGDGVAITSAWRAAQSLARGGFAPGPRLPASADATGSAVAASVPSGIHGA